MRKIAPLYVVVFIGFFGYSMIIPIFSEMLIQHPFNILSYPHSLSIRTTILGVILSMYPLGQFLGSPVLGALSDRFGRKPILVFSLLVTTICYLLIAIALIYAFVSWVFIALFIAGFSEANIVTAQGAVTDISEKHERSHRFGYIFACASLGFILGPIFGGQLASSHIVSWFNYDTPFWCASALLFLLFLWILLGFEETYAQEKRKHTSISQAFVNMRLIITDRCTRKYYLLIFLVAFVSFGFLRTYPAYIVKQFHLKIDDVANVFAIVSIPIGLTNLFLIKPLTKAFSSKALAITGTFILGIGLIVLIYMPTVLYSLLPSIFIGMAFALTSVVMISLLSHATHDHHQGKALGNAMALQVGAQALSAFIGGALVGEFFGYSFYLFAVIALFTCLLTCLLKLK